MQEAEPPRWTYRLDAYRDALLHLADAVEEERGRGLSDLEKMGLIHAFEFTVELGWKLMKDVLAAQGFVASSLGPNDVIRTAYESQIVGDGRGWLKAVRLRNELSHVYKRDLFLAAVPAIVETHYAVLAVLPDELEQLQSP